MPLGVLFEGYKRGVYWWEAVYIGRRFAVGVLSHFARRDRASYAWARPALICVNIVALALSCWFRPFKRRSENFIDALVSFFFKK